MPTAEVLPLCQHCIATIGGACAGPDLTWRPLGWGETCGADDCEGNLGVPAVRYDNEGRTGDGTVGDTLGNSVKLFLAARKFTDEGAPLEPETQDAIRSVLLCARPGDYVELVALYEAVQAWRLYELHGLAFDRVYGFDESRRRRDLLNGRVMARALRSRMTRDRDAALAEARQCEARARALRRALKAAC